MTTSGSRAAPSGQNWFFAGIGGSGMLPLALIVASRGVAVAGSDRAHDAGRSAAKFAWLAAQGITLHPQDGSGITSPAQVLVASAAVETSVPEVQRAVALGCRRLTRAEALAELVNAAACPITIGGTSGKSTITGMIGWILTACGHNPTIMNGAVMRNLVSAETPFAAARIGDPDVFVSEVDESDGSIVLYRPRIAVLSNVSLDHHDLTKLRALFGDFVAATTHAVINREDPEASALIARAPGAVTFGWHAEATLRADPATLAETPTTIRATIHDARDGRSAPLALAVPGRHNLMNALAALGAATLAGVDFADACAALADFAGLARRFEVVGTSPGGVTVIDDFAHNPDKTAATLATLRTHPGRVLVMFQPHGFGPLRQMGRDLATVFARGLNADDRVLVTDPAYFGGTVDRSIGSADFAGWINASADRPLALHVSDAAGGRAAAGAWLLAEARPGDRVVVMGARDDTLSDFARELLGQLA